MNSNSSKITPYQETALLRARDILLKLTSAEWNAYDSGIYERSKLLVGFIEQALAKEEVTFALFQDVSWWLAFLADDFHGWPILYGKLPTLFSDFYHGGKEVAWMDGLRDISEFVRSYAPPEPPSELDIVRARREAGEVFYPDTSVSGQQRFIEEGDMILILTRDEAGTIIRVETGVIDAVFKENIWVDVPYYRGVNHLGPGGTVFVFDIRKVLVKPEHIQLIAKKNTHKLPDAPVRLNTP